ncbi:isochorismatase family protein [Nesterenkonia populi]|uniref:isochorismatase family protein n=1 Tax=Nesterenkonia populi TaxID=1591087 RepID=UPI0011BF94C4|nr:isochorismatase family protein [Nesterenkonia populi]
MADRRIAASIPYAWPWDGGLSPGRTALLVLSAPGGPVLEALPGELESFARELEHEGGLALQILTQDPRYRRAPDVPLLPADRLLGDRVLTAAGLDGFFGSPLDTVLRRQGRDQLLLAGTWLETSVHSTMRTANDRGYECLLLTDLSPALETDLATGAVSCIEMSGGIFGAVSTAAEYLRQLRRPAADPTDDDCS